MDIKSMLFAFETELQIVITVHDLRGFFTDTRNSFLGDYSLHRHPFCCYGRKKNTSWDARCLKNCLEKAHHTMQACPEPRKMECWKGGQEIQIPLLYKDVLQGVLYAGVFAEASSSLPKKHSFNGYDLPLLSKGREHTLIEVLKVLSVGIIEQALLQRQGSRKQSRKQKIEQLLHVRSHEKLSLEALGDFLGVSASRASHIVKEDFGISFIKLLTHTRIAKAQILLKTTQQPLAGIAYQTGFQNSFYFNTCFKKSVGVAPGAYRAQQSENKD